MANLSIIRDLCEQKNIKIRELASCINKDESTIQAMIRTGSTNTSTLEDIAKILDVSASVFFDECQCRNLTGTERKNNNIQSYITTNRDKQEIEILKERLKDKDEIIVYQKDLISMLKKQSNLKKQKATKKGETQ